MAVRIDETFEFATRLIKPGPTLPSAGALKKGDGNDTPKFFTLLFDDLMGLLHGTIRHAPKG